MIRANRADETLTANYYVLGEATMPTSLTKCEFMDSATDIKYVLNPDWNRKIALGIAEWISEVLEENQKVSHGYYTKESDVTV